MGENAKGGAAAKGKRESGAVGEGRAACEEPACSTRRAAAATAAACAYGVDPVTTSPSKPERIIAELVSVPVPVPVGEPDPEPETGHEPPNEWGSEGSDVVSGGCPACGCGDELLLPNASEESD